MHADALIILGDLFEAWIGDDADDPAANTVRRQLAQLANQGTRCLLMQGNRDFLMGERLAADCRAQAIPDPTVRQLATQTVLLCHGDALCTDDTDYMRLRPQLRSDGFQAAMLARPQAERVLIGRDARERSRAANANKPDAIMDVNQCAVDDAMDSAGADVIVHGHTHRPGDHRWTHAGRPRRRLVLGAWENGCVYARATATGLELVSWP